MKHFVLKYSAIFLLFLMGCEEQGEDKRSIQQLKEKISEDTINSILSAQNVEKEEVEISKERGYAYNGFGKPLSNQEVAELKNLLLNDESFEFNEMKKCLFIPKIAFHFKTKNQPPVTVLYSPWCKQIKVIEQNREVTLEIDSIADAIEHLLKGENR